MVSASCPAEEAQEEPRDCEAQEEPHSAQPRPPSVVLHLCWSDATGRPPHHRARAQKEKEDRESLQRIIESFKQP